MMVKICGITNREDALAAAEAGASAIGFNFYQRSPRYVDPTIAAEIAAGLTLMKVGVFVNEPPAGIMRICEIVQLDVIQLHGDENPASTSQHQGRVWKAFRVTETWSAEQLESYPAEAFLLDAPARNGFGGSGESFEWNRARGVQKRIILAGGLDADNVRTAIEEARPWGVDACSRLESAPGRKDREKMQRFIKAALAENL